jgi:threonine/homoserine/homoserine lactone efflux protein
MLDLLLSMNLPLFIPAALVLIVIPGPVVLYVVTRSADQGRKAGMLSVLGSEIGNLCHVVLAALGLSAIVLSSALAFDVVKYLGAAYLIYLGIRKLLSSAESTNPTMKSESRGHIVLQGIAVAILNPKTALFFFAFLPQFVNGSKGAVPVQILFLGLIMVVLAFISDSIYALLTGTFGKWLRNSPSYQRFQHYFSGSVYIGLGITAALVGNHKK